MKLRKMVYRLLAAICFMVAYGAAFYVQGDEPRDESVTASDLVVRIKIIGLLGHPLGEMLTVRGNWWKPEEPAKDMSPRFRITQINEKQVENAFEFRSVEPAEAMVGAVKKAILSDGQTWELRGYETGGISRDVPNGAYKELLQLGVPPFQQSHGFGFVTRFCYISAKRVSGSPPEAREQRQQRRPTQ